MRALFGDPVFWGALMALLGVLIGNVTSGWGKKKDHDLATIQATVSVLSAEVKRLSDEVKEIREKWANSEKRYRLLTEKYSTALAVIHALMVQLGLAGVPPEDMPAVPDLIAIDMQPIPEIIDPTP